MKYGMIIDCVFPHELLNLCIESVLERDEKPDKIYLVEDSLVPQTLCKDTADKYGLGYLKSTGPRWQENNFAVSEFYDCDYLIVSHSDIDFETYPDWFPFLRTSWEQADPRVACLSLGVDAFRYHNGRPVYQWRCLSDQRYGLAIDMHVQNRPLPDARKRVARLSPISSYDVSFLKEVSPIEIDFDCELFLKMTLNLRWGLWLSNPPISHLMGDNGGADTDVLIRKIEVGEYTNEEYFAPLYRVQKEFKEKYKVELYDYLYHDFGLNKWNEKEAIMYHANEKTLYKLDPLLEKIREDIINQTVPSYEHFYV